MASVQDAVAEMKREMTGLAISGHAARRRGIIVTPAIFEVLQKETDGHFTGRIGVRSVEGNRRIHYSFYVLADPSLQAFDSGANFIFVHHQKEAYEENILGRIPAVMNQARRKVGLGRLIMIRELNPILGVVEVNWSSGGRYLYQVDYDEVVAVAQEAIAVDKYPLDEIYDSFDQYNLVFNPPEAEWLGRLKFGKHNGYLESVEMPPEPFLWEGPLEGKLIGRLLMRPDPLRIVGVARDGYGKVREIPVGHLAEDTTASHFAPVAIKDFLPEEIFIACRMHSVQDFNWLCSLPNREHWGKWYDPERVGRIEEYNRTGPLGNGFVLSAGFVNTRAKERDVEIAYADESKGEAWKQLRAEYFPPDWQGWPETRMDKAFARVAATL